MRSDRPDLASDILDLLIDTPSSGGALYWTLARLADSEDQRVEPRDFLDALDTLEVEGAIRGSKYSDNGAIVEPSGADRRSARAVYLDSLAFLAQSDPPHDVHGILYDITEEGRRRWQAEETHSVGDGEDWVLDDTPAESIFTILAATEDAAHIAAKTYLRIRPDLKRGLCEIDPLRAPFKLRSGVEVKNGVRMRIHYSVSKD